MINEEAVSPSIRVADILEQIEGLDKMIALHRRQSPDDVMLKQYQYIRLKFYRELAKLMKKYHFNLSEAKSRKLKSKTMASKSTAKLPVATR